MRKFYLEIDGVRTSLNNESGLLLTSPTGLGVSFSNTYSSITDGFFYNSNTKQTQGQVVGTLNILSSAYSNYETFANNLLMANKLTLIYKPLSIEYKADVELAYITKAESVTGVYMSCPIAFDLKSLWYTEETLTGTGSVSVSHAGQIGSAIKLTTTGTALSNPVITLTDTAIFSKIEIIATLLSTDRIEYSNLYDDSHITGTISGVAVDFLQYVSLGNIFFGHSAHNYTIAVTDDNSATPNITVLLRKYWRSV